MATKKKAEAEAVVEKEEKKPVKKAAAKKEAEKKEPEKKEPEKKEPEKKEPAKKAAAKKDAEKKDAENKEAPKAEAAEAKSETLTATVEAATVTAAEAGKKEVGKETPEGEKTAEAAVEEPEEEGKKKKRRRKKDEKPEDVNIVKDLLSLIIYIGIVILICFLIITYVGRRTTVHGDSMNPTLESGDMVYTEKISTYFHSFERGDIVILDGEGMENYDRDEYLIKRVIGLPGETVRIADGCVYIKPADSDEFFLLDGVA